MNFFEQILSIAIVAKGISAHLLKENVKRRRSKQQIKDEKAAELRKQREIARKLAEYEELMPQLKKTQEIIEEKENYRQLCGQLFDNGIIKQQEDGCFVPVDDPIERESIRSKTKQRIQQEAQSEQQTVIMDAEFNQPILEEEEERMEELK